MLVGRRDPEEEGLEPGVQQERGDGIDELDLEQAVHFLWKENIYAEAAMGCTGPVVKLAVAHLEKAREILKAAGYI